jgi:hypothetical protein
MAWENLGSSVSACIHSSYTSAYCLVNSESRQFRCAHEGDVSMQVGVQVRAVHGYMDPQTCYGTPWWGGPELLQSGLYQLRVVVTIVHAYRTVCAQPGEPVSSLRKADCNDCVYVEVVHIMTSRCH